MGTSLAIHSGRAISTASRRPFAETVDDRIKFARAELCARRGARAPSEARDLGNGRLDLPRCAGDRLPTFIFRPSSIGAMPRASRAIYSAARWRANRCGSWRGRSRRLQPVVARLTNGVAVQVPDRRRRRHQCAAGRISMSPEPTTPKRRWRRLAYITAPVRAVISPKATITRRWCAISNVTRLGLIAKNPDVKFDIYFPPYSILQFVAMRDAVAGGAEDRLRFHRLCQPAAGAVSERARCMISARRRTSRMTSNNYGDVIHHSPAIDLKVLSMLAERKYVVDRAAPTGVAGAAQGAGRGV